VSASDEDADNHGAIVYTLSAPYNPNDLEYFEIQPESGWIVLKKPLDVSRTLSTIAFSFSTNSLDFLYSIDDDDDDDDEELLQLFVLRKIEKSFMKRKQKSGNYGGATRIEFSG